MLRDLWNLGIKVQNLDDEIAFLQACGATDLIKGDVNTPDGLQAYATVRFGSERLMLFPHVIYEPNLKHPLHQGLTHAVFTVENVDEAIHRFRQHGIHPMWGPQEVSAPSFGRRRIAFFRSPSGFIFEVFQALSSSER